MRNKIILWIIAGILAVCTVGLQVSDLPEDITDILSIISGALTLIFASATIPKLDSAWLLIIKKLWEVIAMMIKKRKTKIVLLVFILGLSGGSQMCCSVNPATEAIIESIDYLRLKMVIENKLLDTEQKQELLQAIEEKSSNIGKLVFELRHPLILNNPNIDEASKEWWLVLIMQDRDYTPERIDEGIYLYRQYGDIIPSKEILDKIGGAK